MVKLPKMRRRKNRSFAYRGRRLLHIDLEKETSHLIELSEEESNQLIGGRLLALSLWERFVSFDKLEPSFFEAHNPLVLAPALAADLEPESCGSMTLVTKDPQRGKLAVSTVQTSFSTALLNCGYSAVVFTGRCRRLTGVTLDHDQVEFFDAESFHDLPTGETKHRAKIEHILCIGPAAERQIPHCSICINNQNIPFSSALGLVMGLKNVKLLGLVPHVSGREGYDPGRLGIFKKRLEQSLRFSALAQRVHEEGDVRLLEKANTFGWAAIGTHRYRYDLRLVHLYERFDGRADTYSLIEALALGANLEIFEPSRIAQLARRCKENGLDPASVGVLLGWARVARKEGTLSFLPDLQSRLVANYLKVLDAISYGKGSGHQLGKRLDQLVAEYGGKNGCYCIGSQPLGPFDYRALPTQALLASMGDHRIVLGELIRGGHYRRGKAKRSAAWALYLQRLWGAQESVGLSPYVDLPFFGRWYPHIKGRRSRFAMSALIASISEGRTFTAQHLASAGKRAWSLEREINRRLGWQDPPFAEQQLLDGRSNFPKSQVVPLALLRAAYHELLKRW